MVPAYAQDNCMKGREKKSKQRYRTYLELTIDPTRPGCVQRARHAGNIKTLLENFVNQERMASSFPGQSRLCRPASSPLLMLLLVVLLVFNLLHGSLERGGAVVVSQRM